MRIRARQSPPCPGADAADGTVAVFTVVPPVRGPALSADRGHSRSGRLRGRRCRGVAGGEFRGPAYRPRSYLDGETRRTGESLCGLGRLFDQRATRRISPIPRGTRRRADEFRHLVCTCGAVRTEMAEL